MNKTRNMLQKMITEQAPMCKFGGLGGYYVGTNKLKRDIFYSHTKPTKKEWGDRFRFVSGPFSYKKCKRMIACSEY